MSYIIFEWSANALLSKRHSCNLPKLHCNGFYASYDVVFLFELYLREPDRTESTHRARQLSKKARASEISPLVINYLLSFLNDAAPDRAIRVIKHRSI